MEWLNYHHLLNFWLTAREGSIQRASELLHVTPASVSVQIKQLERTLDVKLFKKQGRGLALTSLGEQVATYAEEIFSTGQELMNLVKGRPLGEPILLRVGVCDVLPKLVAYRFIRPALHTKTSIKLTCLEGSIADLIPSLAIHKLDVILADSALDPIYNVQAHSHLLGKSQVIIAGTHEMLERYAAGFPRSLEVAPLLVPTSANVLRHQLERWFRDRGMTPKIVAEFADTAMMKIAARDGLGILPIPEVMEEEVRNLYGLHRVGLVAEVEEHYYAISKERKLMHPGVQAIRTQQVI